MKKLVNQLNESHSAFGNYKKKITLNEIKNKNLMRRSVYAKEDIMINDKITLNNIKFVRPEIKSNLNKKKNKIEKKAKKKIKKNKLIIL